MAIPIFDTIAIDQISYLVPNTVTGKVWGLRGGPRELFEFDPTTSPPTLLRTIVLPTTPLASQRSIFPRNLIIQNNIAWYANNESVVRVDLVTEAIVEEFLPQVPASSRPDVLGIAVAPDAATHLWVLYQTILASAASDLVFTRMNPTTLVQETATIIDGTDSEPTNAITFSRTQIYMAVWDSSAMKIRVFNPGSTTVVREGSISVVGEFGLRWIWHDFNGHYWIHQSNLGGGVPHRVRKFDEVTFVEPAAFTPIDQGNVIFGGIEVIAGRVYVTNFTTEKVTRHNYTTGALEDTSVAVPTDPRQLYHDGTLLWVAKALLVSNNSHRLSDIVPWTLVVTKSGAGTGVITSAPSGINCGADCTEDFGDTTVVTLTATPDTGMRFIGWSGDIIGTTNPDTVTMTQARNVNAQFEGLAACAPVPVSSGLGACAAVPASPGLGACP